MQTQTSVAKSISESVYAFRLFATLILLGVILIMIFSFVSYYVESDSKLQTVAHVMLWFLLIVIFFAAIMMLVGLHGEFNIDEVHHLEQWRRQTRIMLPKLITQEDAEQYLTRLSGELRKVCDDHVRKQSMSDSKGEKQDDATQQELARVAKVVADTKADLSGTCSIFKDAGFSVHATVGDYSSIGRQDDDSETDCTGPTDENKE